MNLWKDIPAGDKPPGLVNMIVEVASGSRDKYEYKIDWEAFVLDRVLYSPVVFPVEYGFIPQTWYEDNDPLDAMVLSYEHLEVGCVVKVRVVGVIVMEDEEGEDPKILGVPTTDPRYDGFNTLEDVHPSLRREIQEFFEIYKRLEPKKWTKFKEWRDVQGAYDIINYARHLYAKKTGSKKRRRTHSSLIDE